MPAVLQVAGRSGDQLETKATVILYCSFYTYSTYMINIRDITKNIVKYLL